MTSTELFAKAQALDALAADVEIAIDPAKSIADSPDWECANATDVRGALNGWRSAAQSAARNLRDEASRVRGEARRAEEREEQEERDARRERQPQ
ncbi:hypothetical protein OMK64_02230 [Cellulomonas fimi]|uniref:hypothetical protein n=1 Tax=Cellulomonas fimi TaxID=1708 RepID=UPI00234C2687|nr:hypothetical protein [Cellulomonas fimi]MDC7120348.1 hypothetical protein [Cellulomonas fimi]